jgi:hypothetical protein
MRLKPLFVGLAITVVFLVSAASSLAGGTPATVHQGQCSIEVDGYGLVSGEGTLVIAPSGQVVSVCNIAVSPPPPDTVVTTFPGVGGDIFVVTAGGEVVAVFTPCGPSQPCG